jgi:hypothetical protein
MMASHFFWNEALNCMMASKRSLGYYRDFTAEFYPEIGAKADDFFPSERNIHDKILY